MTDCDFRKVINHLEGRTITYPVMGYVTVTGLSRIGNVLILTSVFYAMYNILRSAKSKSFPIKIKQIQIRLPVHPYSI